MSDSITAALNAEDAQITTLVKDAQDAKARLTAVQDAQTQQIALLQAEVAALPPTVDTSAITARITAMTATLAQVDAGVAAIDPAPATPPAAAPVTSS